MSVVIDGETYTTFNGVNTDAGFAVNETQVIDENGNFVGNVNPEVETVAATSTGVAISADSDFVSLTSASANNIVILPAPSVGKVVRGAIGGTGCEIRSSSPTGVAINNVTGANKEAALAANASFEAVCISSTKWLLRNFSATGAETHPVPD